MEKARQQIESGNSLRAGLLATNSIRGGANRRVLDRIKQSGDIFMAWSDEPWILEGAGVRISIVGFDPGSDVHRVLDGVPVNTINSSLTADIDISAASRLNENRTLSFIGGMKKGPFELSATEAEAMLSMPINPNDRPNSDVVRRWANGLDVTRRPQNQWLVDFGTDRTLEESAMYELPFEHVKRHVYPLRVNHREKVQADRWWLHARPAPDMRAALQKLDRYLCTPRVAKYRLFVWLTPDVLPDCQLVVFAREDDYYFGVLHSRAHEVWSLRMGTSLEDRPRYTPTTCFETFPFPWPPGKEPLDDPRLQAIAAAAKALDDTRRNWLDPEGATEAELKKRTLTNLYNQRPTWLLNLHATLDRAVWDAYGWPAEEVPGEMPQEVILERLLGLNLERTRGAYITLSQDLRSPL
jgi:hypothetical protein